jgi:hypothetical protein
MVKETSQNLKCQNHNYKLFIPFDLVFVGQKFKLFNRIYQKLSEFRAKPICLMDGTLLDSENISIFNKSDCVAINSDEIVGHLNKNLENISIIPFGLAAIGQFFRAKKRFYIKTYEDKAAAALSNGKKSLTNMHYGFQKDELIAIKDSLNE